MPAGTFCNFLWKIARGESFALTLHLAQILIIPRSKSQALIANLFCFNLSSDIEGIVAIYTLVCFCHISQTMSGRLTLFTSYLEPHFKRNITERWNVRFSLEFFLSEHQFVPCTKSASFASSCCTNSTLPQHSTLPSTRRHCGYLPNTGLGNRRLRRGSVGLPPDVSGCLQS